MAADRGMRKINNNKPNNYNNKPVSKLRFFCSTTRAVPCRYCGGLTRNSSSIEDVEIDPENIDAIICVPHVCKLDK